MTGNGSVKLRALAARLSKPFKDDLFKRVIDGIDTLPRVHAAALEATFPEDTLPSSASRRAGLHRAFGEDEGVLVVLACWVELNATLRSEVQGYLLASAPPKDGSDLIKWAYEFGSARFKRNQTKQVEGALMALWHLDLHRRAEELLASIDPDGEAGASANDIGDSEQPASASDELADTTTLVDRLRALLESEPAESVFWDKPEAFRDTFDTIAAHKLASRTSSRRRGEVGESLARLAEEYCEELEYVECTRGPRDFSQVAESELDTIESGVRALEEALRSFRSLSATRPRLIREEREWHLRRDQLATSIARLSVALYGPADEAPPPDGSAPLSDPGDDQPVTEPAMVTDDEAITITSPVTDSEAVHTTGEDAARDAQHPEATATALGGDNPTPGHAGAAVEPVEAVEAKVPTSPDRHDDGPADDAPAVAMPAPATSTPPAAVPTTAARGPVDRDAQLVARIALGDVPGAYWVARAAEASSLQPLVASRVLAVVEAWPLVDHTDSAAVSEVADLLRSFEPATPFEAFAVTCALLPLLPRVRQGLIDVSVAPWLEPSDDYRFLRMVVDPVRDFHQRGLAITAGALDPTMTGEQARENLREAADQCKALLAKSRKHTPSFARAKEVWQTLLDTELTRLLEPAAHNRRNERATVLAAIRDLGTREDRMNRFNDLAATLPGRRVPAIVGESRNQLARWTEEAIQHAQAWLDAERALEGKEEASNGYLAQRCRDLQHDVQTHLGEAQRHCTELLESPSPADRAAGRLAAKTLSALAGSLRLADGGSPAHDPLRALADPPESLHGRLSARLLFCPGVRLSDQRGVAPEQLDGAAALLSGQPWPADPEVAADGWIAQRDFRWVSLLTRGVAPEAAEKILARSRSAEEDARAELATRVRQLDTEVERAVVDGVVAQDYRSLPVFVPYGNLAAIGGDLGRHLQELAVEIARVAGRRADIVARKRESWAHARQDMVRSGWPQASEVTRLVEQAFDRQDLRLIDEYLATLPRRVKLLQEAPPHWFEEHGPRYLRAFAAAGATATTPEPDGDLKLIKAWNDLSRAGRVSRTSQVHGPLGDILAALGFRLQSSGASFTRQHDERGWTQWSVRMHDNEARLVPQFGSEARGEHQVICVWGGGAAIQTALRNASLDRKVAICLIFDSLDTGQWLDIAAQAQREGIVVALLDERLLRHLARLASEQRLEAFLQIALSYGSINPYRPDVRGPVPREVFFGRRDLLAELLSTSGPCIVYGGRRLGKSALLEEARLQFHDPARRKFAVVIDINSVGDPKAKVQPEEIWNILREELKRIGFLGTKVLTSKAPDLVAHILAAFDGESELRLMFDEADDFLDADAEQNFHNVGEFRDLMRKSESRIKAVFAGLHHVQRFQNIPNHPLAAFGKPINVGPLEAEEAHELVLKPMERIGIGFDDQSTVLRVLAATNYHPGLLQLFCSHLVRRVSSQRRTQPPRVITRVDVDAVYNELHADIRNRFDWTLRLDDNYQGIARTFAYHQAENPDQHVLPIDDLFGIVRAWWPRIANVSRERFEGYLDELVGLGVFVKDAKGYRFRSPNLLHLLGGAEELLQSLYDLSARAQEGQSGFDEHHRQLDVRTHRFSVFSHSQETLLGHAGRLCFVFVSEALGLDRVPESIDRFAVDASGGLTRRIELAPADCNAEWVLTLRKERRYDDLLMLALQSLTADSLPVHAPGWLSALDDRTSLILSIPSAPAWAWARWPGRSALLADARVVTVTPAKLTPRALRQRLKAGDIEPTADLLAKLQRITGGWPFLLDEVLGTGRPRRDLLAALREIDAALGNPQSPLARRFASAAGLDACEVARPIAKSYLTLGTTYPSELIPSALVDAGSAHPETDLVAVIEFLGRLGLLIPSTTTPGDVVVDPILARVL